ncbi:MAG: hypothetical protein LDL33_15110, partial [Desulfomonile sp.]|nr:hypothetical protein [Desulfomonile sp.]
DVCLQQTILRGGMKLDLAFVTASEVHVVELKRDVVGPTAIHQLEKYMRVVGLRYPDHTVHGYLLGQRVRADQMFLERVHHLGITLLLYESDVPPPNCVAACGACGAGLDVRRGTCAGCGARRLSYSSCQKVLTESQFFW